MLNTEERKNSVFPPSMGFALWIMAILAAGSLITSASSICLWLVSSFFLFAFLDPLLQKLNRKGVSPLLSSIVLIGFATVFMFLLFFLIYQNVPGLMHLMKTYQKAVAHLIDQGTQQLHSFTSVFSIGDSANASADAADNGFHLPDLNEGISKHFLEGLTTALSIFTFTVMCPVLTFFMISDRVTFAHAFGKIYRQEGQGAQTWKKICDATVAYFLGNMLIGVITWPIFSLLFYFFGVSSPLVLAALASVLNLVPFLGAALSGLIPVLDLLSREQGPGAILGLGAICVFIHFAIANFVTPKVLGKKLDLNATTSMVALVVWGEIWGGLGLLFAIPITATIKVLLEQSTSQHLHWVALLMSDNPENMVSQTYKHIFDIRKPAKNQQ